MIQNKKDILLLGIGNEILTDDGIGPKLVEEIKKTNSDPNLHFLNIPTGGMDILEIIRDYNMVIIIDAIITENGKPGDVYHLTPDHFRETLHISSFHDISFNTMLKMAEKLEIKIPSRIDIFAVEIVEDMTFGSEFCPEIRNRFPEILRKVLSLVQESIGQISVSSNR